MLTLERLSCGYGAAIAVQDLDLRLAAGEVVALIGPNGAGKTSTIQCIAGHVHLHSGRISLNGRDLGAASPQARVASGIAVAPEGRRLFGDMTVRENLIVGGLCRPRAAALRNMQRILTLFPRLSERIDALASTLSGGEQQMVAIGRALMAEPRVLMIDELSLGLMPKNVDICYQAIEQLKGDGLAILLVEQSLSRTLQAADRAYVLESGRLVWSGTAAEARLRSDLIEACMGLPSHGSFTRRPDSGQVQTS